MVLVSKFLTTQYQNSFSTHQLSNPPSHPALQIDSIASQTWLVQYVMVLVWWLVSMSLSDQAEIWWVEACVDVPIRPVWVVSDELARVEDPIRPDGVVRCLEFGRVDDPIRLGRVVNCAESAPCLWTNPTGQNYMVDEPKLWGMICHLPSCTFYRQKLYGFFVRILYILGQFSFICNKIQNSSSFHSPFKKYKNTCNEKSKPSIHNRQWRWVTIDNQNKLHLFIL